ncbi:hypothetical protein [uncultured Marinobacter sp.]|uniref:hypothetical protein n=1 Tax=uncultured Marinobacter sp. TaxID=187379 RepID=UPI00258FA7C9|nr:hypothetical protein [uncultured Marinobacter sp.]
MTTQYSQTLTLAVPAPLTEPANHLAALVGESPADINTFRQATYTDGTTDYAVAHTACTPTLLERLTTGQLPAQDIPEGVDLELAKQALDAINAEGGALMAIDVDPHEQFAAWGLEPIRSDDEALI